MRKLSALVIVAIAGLGAAAPADAADMPRKRPKVQVIKPIPVPVVIDTVTSGWYVRADFGHRWYSLSHVVPATGFTPPTGNNVSSGWFGGIGAGFKQDWLRVDVTADWGTGVTYTGQAAAGDVTAKFRANTVLLNAYYEPYTWNGFTPYIGVGAGAAHVTVSGYSSTAIPPFTPVGASKQWNFAYAVMVGSSFAVTRNVLLDVGYRYLGLGTADTPPDSTGRVAEFKNIAAHELRFGVRFFFPDPVTIR